jgi:hypothetical protein
MFFDNFFFKTKKDKHKYFNAKLYVLLYKFV